MAYVLWEGPSLYDGVSPIIVLATANSANRKTGDMVQTWILRSDVPPNVAVKKKLDSAICGTCPARGGWCYVLPHQAPTAVFHAERLPPPKNLVAHRPLRLGAYGDPAVVPFEVWEPYINQAPFTLGYTHLWEVADTRMRKICLASVSTMEEARKAQAMGWRTARVAQQDWHRVKGEVVCPNPTTGLQCRDCRYCDGNARGLKGNVVFPVHGAPWKIARFEETLASPQFDGVKITPQL